MDITVQRDIHIGVTKYFAEALCVDSYFHAPRRECVAERVKVGVIDSTFFQQSLKTILHCTRLRKSVFLSGQQKCPGLIRFPHLVQYDFWNRNDPDGAAAFGRCHCNPGLFPADIRLKPLHRLVYIDGSISQGNIIPFQGA